jgi:acetoin utilization deacetylase AcuC-like enzyme
MINGTGTEEGFLTNECVFYGSTHERDAYPGTGIDPSPYVGERARDLVHRRIVNRKISPGPQSREDFHSRWREILDEMIRFGPELIIISAGTI